MPEVTYRTPGIPPGPANGITAFTPHYNRPAGSGAQSYKYDVTGEPGTRAIPMPHSTAAMHAGNPVAQARMGTSRSTDAPPEFWPQLYYQRVIAERPGAGMPVQIYDPVAPGLTTLLPVPAEQLGLTLRRDSARLSRRALLNRVRQLPWWPRAYGAPDA